MSAAEELLDKLEDTSDLLTEIDERYILVSVTESRFSLDTGNDSRLLPPSRSRHFRTRDLCERGSV